MERLQQSQEKKIQSLGIQRRSKPLVKDLNEHIICPLCRGYLIDATTLVECLHSFCRGCIVRRLKAGPKNCPICSAIAAQDPLLPDLVLQKIVYLVVPGLLKSEQERRRHFRQVNPQCTNLDQLPMGVPEVAFDDLVSLSLSEVNSTSEGSTRYLKCPAGVTVRHLVRLLMLKRGWDNNEEKGQKCKNSIEMLYEVVRPRRKVHLEVLDSLWTLVDLACIFKWTKEAPMKLLYRIVQVEETAIEKSVVTSNLNPVITDISNQVIENIQRPPTPPPSPKPPLSLNKTSRSTTTVDQYTRDSESKKPRCEVTPVLRSPDPMPEEHKRKSDKISKLEHQHKRKKRRNKKVIAELATPREDPMKLKFRLTQVPQRVSTNTNNATQSKEKLIQMRAVRKEKTKDASTSNSQMPKEEKDNVTIVTEAKIIEQKAEETKTEEKPVKLSLKINESIDKKNDLKLTVSEVKKVEKESSPKNEEVLRKLGLIAISEANKTRRDKMKGTSQSNEIESNPALEREKLEKQLRESKANRVRSLLAEKQMRDTLKSIMSNSKDTNSNSNSTTSSKNSASITSSVTNTSGTSSGSSSSTSSLKRKDLPPLTPIRNSKRTNVTFAPSLFPSGKSETPLDLSSPSHTTKESALDLSSSINSEPSPVKSNSIDKPVGILRNSTARMATSSPEKPKEEKKTQETNLRTLSDAAVSLLGGSTSPSKLPQSYAHNSTVSRPNVSSKVALRIPQPHQRITGFSMKMKPSIGVRHIPNPQAVVASQYRNQRTGLFGLAHQPP